MRSVVAKAMADSWAVEGGLHLTPIGGRGYCTFISRAKMVAE